MKKRFISVILCICVLLSAVPAVADTQQLTDKTFTVTMSNGFGKATSEVNIFWKDMWFAAPSTTYNHDLARTLMALSGAAYLPNGVTSALSDADFSHIYSHVASPTREDCDSVSYVFASKPLCYDAFSGNLAVIVIKGTSANDEWHSNFNIGSGETHLGFDKAAAALEEDFENYMTANNLSWGNTKVVITGHSRGAAVGNIVSADFTSRYASDRENIFSYTFATPNTTTNPDAKSDFYNNIFSIINPEDFIVHVPLTTWGYTRYGIDLSLPSVSTYTSSFESIKSRMTQSFSSFTDAEFEGYTKGTENVTALLKALETLSPTLADYYNKEYYLIYPNPWMEEVPMITAEVYFSYIAEFCASGDINALANLGKSLAGNFYGVSSFFITQSGAGIGDWKFNAGIWCAHCPATYYSYMTALDANELFGSFNSLSSDTYSSLALFAPYDVSAADSYYNYIVYVCDRGIMNGVSNNRFAPDETLTRAMLVTILYRCDGSPTAGRNNTFKDVLSSAWYTDAIIWASENGIVQGYGNGNFGPDDDITREQLATILYRFAAYKGYDIEAKSSLPDSIAVSGYAREAYEWAYGNDFLNVEPAPQLPSTRADAACAIAKLTISN